MKSVYYKYMFESERKEFNKDTYKDFQFETLTIEQMCNYIYWCLQEVGIPVIIRPSDNNYRKLIAEFQNENQRDYAIRQFMEFSGIQAHGTLFKANDVVIEFAYNMDIARPMNHMGVYLDDRDEGALSRWATAMKQGKELGRRLTRKPNLKRVAAMDWWS